MIKNDKESPSRGWKDDALTAKHRQTLKGRCCHCKILKAMKNWKFRLKSFIKTVHDFEGLTCRLYWVIQCKSFIFYVLSNLRSDLKCQSSLWVFKYSTFLESINQLSQTTNIPDTQSKPILDKDILLPVDWVTFLKRGPVDWAIFVQSGLVN